MPRYYPEQVITAFVMLQARPDRIPEVATEVAGIEGVREVYSVTGDVDLVAVVRVEKQDDLADVIADQLGKVEGVMSTRTYLAFRTYSPDAVDDALTSGFDD
ncbi:Lrp/AsnC ligand binding domain-containing protein [Kineosporia mesophila]|uniref:Lrp/AsnC ligand binding domain-containing protein n=1 Tax=Kineosporia mesophila TaxID=566012 RepID=A0ABP6YW03_9ACTN